MDVIRMARGKRGKAKKAAGGDGRYKLTYANGRTATMSKAEFAAAYTAGDIPTGTMVSHPGGWYVVGASIADVFEFD